MVEKVIASSTETPLSPYKSRFDAWCDKVSEYRVGDEQDKQQAVELLGQGYQLFFEMLEPLKNEDWLRSEKPDGEKEIYVRTNDSRLRGFDSKLFAGDTIRYQEKWGINIHSWNKFSDESANLLIESAAHGSLGKKLVRIILKPYFSFGPKGAMIIEDRILSYVGTFEEEVVTTQDKRLSDYPALTICKLAVSCTQIFVEGHQANQSNLDKQSNPEKELLGLPLI